MKKFYIYAWIVIISISIEIPSYISIFDLGYDTSLIIDLDEESEDAETSKDTELELFSHLDTYVKYTNSQNKTEILFITKGYNSISVILDSPPPEHV